MKIPRDLWNLTSQLFHDEILLFNASTSVQDGYVHEVGTSYNPRVQCLALVLLILLTLLVNLCIVVNVQRSEIKRRMANFTLISHLCTVDMLGSLFISPLPLWATWRGSWTHNEFVCVSSCVAVLAFWIQHVLVFSLLKCDQVLAGWLPVGSYPAVSADAATFVVLGVWAVSFGSSGLVVSVYGSMFEPAVMLCIPNLPTSFFLVVFVIYCLLISSMVLGYLVVACVVRRHRTKVSYRRDLGGDTRISPSQFSSLNYRQEHIFFLFGFSFFLRRVKELSCRLGIRLVFLFQKFTTFTPEQ